MLHIGVAGWSYPDWEGRVYPKPKPKGFDPLVYLADMVNAIEINSTFYHPGPAKNPLSWVRRLSGHPEFKFTVKLWQRFTHPSTGSGSSREREPFGAEEVKAARVVPEILGEAGLLGAVLLQFPWSFKNTEENREWLGKVAAEFSGFPLAVEVRHSSWDRPEVRARFLELAAALCNLDQPVIGDSIPPAANATPELSYVRFHGRNYRDWFREGAGRDDRYNYLYTEEELRPWQERIREMEGKSKEVYVIYNNHFQGKALVNALQMQKAMGRTVPIPGPLLAAYPLLRALL